MIDEIILSTAAQELEEMKICEESTRQHTHGVAVFKPFPKNCLRLLQLVPGNRRCMDCNASNPQWASTSYGALLCIECSGCHRHMGVEVGRRMVFT